MKAAMITPGFLPVPAVNGGAVEVLITDILEGNEKEHRFDFDVYTIPSKELDHVKYRYSRIVQIQSPFHIRLRCRLKNLCYRLQGSPRRSAYLYESVCSSLEKEEYDFIFVENNMNLYREIYNRTKYSGKMLFHMHNDVDDTVKTPAQCRLVADTAKGIFTVSEYLKKSFCSVAPNDKTKVFYNCVDLDLFRPSQALRKKARRRFGLDEEDTAFLYAGRLDPPKGVLELIRAFQALCRCTQKVRLLIAGDVWFDTTQQNDYGRQVRREALELQDKIIFTGTLPPEQMPEAYAAADVAAIPTLCEEAFGMAALEAVAMGVSVIATRSGGLPEIVDDSCAVLIERGEGMEQRFAKGMQELLEDKTLRLRLAQRAAEKLKATPAFWKENYFPQFCSLVNQAIQRQE